MKRKKNDIKRRLLDTVKDEVILTPLPPHDVILDPEDVARHDAAIKPFLHRAQCIEASNIARYFEETYVGEDKDGRAWWNDLKCLVPPFETFFVEWEKPHVPTSLRMGVLFIACAPEAAADTLRSIIGENAQYTPKKIQEFRDKHGERVRWIYLTFDFLEFDNSKQHNISGIRSPFHIGAVAVAEDGALLDFWLSHASGAITRKESETIGAASMPAWTALAMMNCDNIETVEHVAPEPFQRSRTRKGKQPLVSFRTIQVNLDKTPKSIQAEQLPEVDGEGKVRLHQKRGHMKDYRKGKGLFGKYKGLWYWGSTLAGSGAEGVVVSNYEVKAK